jgi:hypothetical protein
MTLLTEIGQIHAVDAISCNEKHQTIILAYDETHTNLEQIEQFITRYGADIGDGIIDLSTKI